MFETKFVEKIETGLFF